MALVPARGLDSTLRQKRAFRPVSVQAVFLPSTDFFHVLEMKFEDRKLVLEGWRYFIQCVHPEFSAAIHRTNHRSVFGNPFHRNVVFFDFFLEDHTLLTILKEYKSEKNVDSS